MADDSETKPDGSGALRSVGEALGGWARRARELVADATGRPVVSEAVRTPLTEARTLRLEGEVGAAAARLRAVQAEHPGDLFVQLDLGLCYVHDLIRGGRPQQALAQAQEDVGEELGRGPDQLLAAATQLSQDRPDRALDNLRRADPELARLPEPVEEEARWLLHILGGLCHLQLGNEERALRELQKARARAPQHVGPVMRELVLSKGAQLALTAGELRDAEGWARQSLGEGEPTLSGRRMLCRVLAARGDTIGAHALLEELAYEYEDEVTRGWVGLTVGLPEDSESLQKIALRLVQGRPDDPFTQRVWALAQLREATESNADVPSTSLCAAILEPLAQCAARAPAASGDRYLQELAHAALRLDAIVPIAVEPVLKRLDRDRATAPEELRLLRARHRLASGEDLGDDIIAANPPRFRADPAIGGPWGPDPRSPARNPDVREGVVASQRQLVAAELCIQQDREGVASDLLVDAIIQWPQNRRARGLLASAQRGKDKQDGPRLEQLLKAATKLLAAVPERVLGVSLAGVAAALTKVVAARERLARALTIAIMGEFSAGKSTFVNALLGEDVAPMGVLPTTTTINVFRRGTSGGARVHYRDGRIATVDPDEVHSFLHGLDDTEAQRIRHVEIERTGERMGDAAVVDTPGLNALDEFHEEVARSFLDEADAVVWVFSATRSGAASEVSMLEELRKSGRQVLGVLNKVDTLDAAEQDELATYLRDQLGDVLVEVVPLRGREALAYRIGEARGEDPFAGVEAALNKHFLRKARELKRALTARRLGEALALARDTLEQAASELEAQADTAVDSRDRPSAAALLLQFSEALEPRVLDADDALTREALGLGVLEARKGRAKGPLDPLDDDYLGGCLRDAMLAGLRRALSEVARKDPAASEVLDEVFVPWARGHLEGLLTAGFIAATLEEHGDAIAEGETAARAAFRAALRPVVAAWVAHAGSLVHQVERARRRADRALASAPRAEALRLRTTVLAPIEGLRETAQGL